MDQNKIPQATAKRLPLYYRFLNNLNQQGKRRVSSKELSEAVKVDSATIRRDFSYFGALGKKGYGYNVEYLLGFFRSTLDQHEVTEVALIGAGNLGTAFLKYSFLKNNNIRITKAFDADSSKVGKDIDGVPIFHVSDLEEELENIRVVILTVPASEAEEIAEKLVNLGVNGILNFTPARITVPSHVRVHHIDLAVELQSLVYFLKHYPLEKE
ncbi:redox-sensing transcriptional repressor Rex [Oceanobacillus caeni]|uniref:Redox-sensing transcriptional repressor Rex n=1 Tax=Oceanobacillus caeni TaxID=405946 RepID=A0ABR5MI40_9BACI|nr:MULTISPECIES: redox-sensing transcriptional repressor Rex [Bacillaceae]KKE78957.1 redox-sensing transcriptional repressor Rex [Bacilli bacterium VT-13-104]PZD86107.1 redox-sensing transcriptional repressor Rex [Bacilli bacterium]KPH73858.1 redox-sensing transcriptional repressor Rex [Oceanobacillus caeni]MBU8791583.1 redox-sensing transcriptional repressor Rex [Oceanobacillus caeni]MCR1835582.1 redox-sensing transcriptional repressor Rex [Oceanobacillus caeni]